MTAKLSKCHSSNDHWLLGRKKKRSASSSFIFLLCYSVLVTETSGQEVPAKPKRDPIREEEMCRNFTVGHPRDKEFYSPLYSRDYPPDIECSRTITADIGYFVRIDFRDVFHVEPMSTAQKCEYDFLEVRDGDEGYSPVIGKYCGSNFPPMITSSGRSLRLRFKSDSTIQYQGFKAVYSFIENPLDHMPDIGKCTFEAGGHQDFVGSHNITKERIEHSLTYDTPIDCVWTIRTEQSSKLYIQFSQYELKHPNDCHLNYIQVYDEKTDEENLMKNFCGSVAETVTSKTNVVYIRFYAEQSGIESQFSCEITSIRSLSTGEMCDPEEEYDCDDATCIHPDLECNGIRNCKFGWDEESCDDSEDAISMDFSSPHVIVIIVVLTLILGGMCAGLIWNLVRKLSADKEELAHSRELRAKSASRMSVDAEAASTVQAVPPPPPAPAAVTSNSRLVRGVAVDSNGGCYVPDAGFPIHARF